MAGKYQFADPQKAEAYALRLIVREHREKTGVLLLSGLGLMHPTDE